MAIFADSISSMPIDTAATISKRQRESAVPEDTTSAKIAKVEDGEQQQAAQPILTVSQTKGAKRPQMKYDPSIPMTKDETSSWRRDQRRKRNRESAAACRKRQRDRISELEVEATNWKAKFEEAMLQLKDFEGEEAAAEVRAQVEKLHAMPPPRPDPRTTSTTQDDRCDTPPNIIPVNTTSMPSATQHIISPHEGPKFIPPITTSSEVDELHFPVLEDSIIRDASECLHLSDSLMTRVENRQHYEKITRPAKSSISQKFCTSRCERLLIHLGYYLMTQ